MPAAGAVTDPRVDPTGQRVAYVADGALHVTELADGTGRLLAAREHDDVSYGLAEYVAAESMLRFRGYWWAPDGQRLLAARVDNSPVQRWWITDPADPERPPRAVRYPAVGTANADVTLHVLRLDGSRTEVTWDRGAYEYIATAEWDSGGPLLSVQSRDQRTVMVLAADAVTGQTTLSPGLTQNYGDNAPLLVKRRVFVNGLAALADVGLGPSESSAPDQRPRSRADGQRNRSHRPVHGFFAPVPAPSLVRTDA